jgi:polyhydroxyalkanoate synthesis regulator phasin
MLEAKREKQKLEQKILTLCSDFTEKTQMEIINISLETARATEADGRTEQIEYFNPKVIAVLL